MMTPRLNMLLLLHASGTRAVAAATCDLTAAQRVAATSQVLDTLRAKGYTITEGVQAVYASTAFGANPGNPYVLYQGLGHVPGTDLPAFKIPDARSAILNLVCTPPGVAYFSWRSYLFSEPFPVFASLGDSLNNLVNDYAVNGYKYDPN